MSWPAKTPAAGDGPDKRTLGKGLFRLCEGCGKTLLAELLAEHFEVCPDCGHHHRLSLDGWERLLLDGAPAEVWDAHLEPTDPLSFSDGVPYPERIRSSQRRAKRREAIRSVLGRMGGIEVGFGAMDFAFMGGSMGSVVGEAVTRLFERATASRLPVVLLQASGGARMQEGILSLMQMAKTVAALERHREAALPYVSLAVHPTTGGVAASFALLGDVNIAEPGALVGFAGPRVIEATIRQKLPPGFQRSEFLLEHGMIDLIAPRAQMRDTIVRILGHLGAAPP
jgi:acetyl-CoA carboxylase carboxyl transferase subunit beta